jgi:hypothetical protein
VGVDPIALVAGAATASFANVGFAKLEALFTAWARRKTELEMGAPVAPSLDERIKQAQLELSDLSNQVAKSVSETASMIQDRLTSALETSTALAAELRARSEALNLLAQQAKEAEARADRARELAAISQPAAEALDEMLDERLAQRLGQQEKGGHRWDTKITVVSLALSIPIGIAAGIVAALLTSH